MSRFIKQDQLIHISAYYETINWCATAHPSHLYDIVSPYDTAEEDDKEFVDEMNR